MKNVAGCAYFVWAKGLKRSKISLAACASAIVLVTGCASLGGDASLARYRCEQGVEFTVKYVDDTAMLNGTRGYEMLYRDAGGVGPKQSVYRNPTLRAEFGLGASGREAVLRYPLLPLVLRCVSDAPR